MAYSKATDSYDAAADSKDPKILVLQDVKVHHHHFCIWLLCCATSFWLEF